MYYDDHGEPMNTADLYLDTVQKRLVNAGLRRRHRFVYAQAHAVKLGYVSKQWETGPREETAVDSSKSLVLNSKREETEDIAISERPRLLQNTKTLSKNQKLLTDTTASVLDVPIRSQMPPAPASEKVMTEISNTASKTNYPLPTVLKADQITFRCPCCCLPLPSDITRNAQRWR